MKASHFIAVQIVTKDKRRQRRICSRVEINSIKRLVEIRKQMSARP